MSEKVVLITGGAGYIGSHAVKLFLERGRHVVVFDNLSRGFRGAVDNLSKLGKVTFVKGDLRDKEALARLFASNHIDSVLHFAALCSVDESTKQPGTYFENNVLGTVNLLEEVRKAGVPIIFSSTCAVYGESQYLPVDEKHRTQPANPYGESKLMAEKVIEWYGKLHGVRYAILRYFNVCGAASDGLVGDSKKPSLLLVQNAVRGAMGIESFSYTCPQVDTRDGTPIRDYIDVEDLVEAHAFALEHLQQGKENLLLNLGSGSGYSVKEIVASVEGVFGLKLGEKQSEPRAGEYAAVYADSSHAHRVLGWKPKKNLEQSILSLKKWYEYYPVGYAS